MRNAKKHVTFFVIYVIIFIALFVFVSISPNANAAGDAGWQADPCFYSESNDLCRQQRESEDKERKDRKHALENKKQMLNERHEVALLKRKTILAEHDANLATSPNYHRTVLIQTICDALSAKVSTDYISNTKKTRLLTKIEMGRLTKINCAMELAEKLPKIDQ